MKIKKTASQRIQIFLGELKRRKVFQVTSFYLVAAWGLSAGAPDIFAALEFPDWAPRYFLVAIFSLTPVVIVIAWVFELDKSGLQRDFGPKTPPGQTTVLAGNPTIPPVTATWLGLSRTFSRDFIVGRDDDCALQIFDPMVSRHHVKFELDKGRWRIVDMGSANGTELNGKKIQNAWLDRSASLLLYPGGPELKVSVGSRARASASTI